MRNRLDYDSLVRKEKMRIERSERIADAILFVIAVLLHIGMIIGVGFLLAVGAHWGWEWLN